MAAEARKTADQGLPKRIGRYEAFLQIGAGGMARVYLAVQRGQAGQKAELVVVKVLRPEVADDPHVLSLFTDEARIAMRLDHPNVIRTREVIAEPPDYLLAMDFHDGRSLLDVLDRLGREAVSLDEHIYILSRVLAGLSYAHELQDEHGKPFGIVHRDVSPANVLVSYGGEVKLLDFGIAKATGALAATRDGVVRGKLGYAAPEQCLGQPADPRSDIYAVGVMLWEAIAGRRRVSGETWQSVLQARLDDTEPALEEVCPDAPPELAVIVEKALARDPANRYSTATEFQIDLERHLREKRGTPIGPARIAAMLKPHFDGDRAELRQAIETFRNTLRSAKTGQVGRIPLPGGRAAPPSPVAPEADEASRPAGPGVKEETTAPIPVDSALLMLSRTEAEKVPESSTPTAPPPPPSSLAATLPPPPDSLATTTPPPPPSSAPAPSLELRNPAVESAPPNPNPAAPEAVAAPRKPAPVEVDPFGLVSVANVGTTPGWTSSELGAAPPKKKTPVWAFMALAVGALGLGAVVVVPQLDSKKSAAPAPEPSALAERTAATPSTTPKVAMVKVRISVDPADAVLKLDGRELSGNPFVATLPRDSAEHQLTAVAEGCKEHQQTVRLHSDLALLVAMKCQRIGMRLSAKPGARRPAAVASAPPPREATVYPDLGPSPPAPASEGASGDNPYK